MRRFLTIFSILFAHLCLAQNISNEQITHYLKLASEGKNSEQAKAPTLLSKSRLRSAAEDISPLDSLKDSTVRVSRRIFGQEIFSTPNLTFAPDTNIATPADYTLGAGDEVIIDIWGANQTTIIQTISPDGYINIEGIGLVALGGQTIAEAEQMLRRRLSKIYSSVGSKTEIKLTLGQIRTIDIHILGEVLRPGTYPLSSLSTAFYALYHAGGVGDLGSLRTIRIVRNGEQVATIDIYKFIMEGQNKNNIRLKGGDMVIVPPHATLVEVKGRIKRPMHYELLHNESLTDLLDYAGGFSADAYKKSVTITRSNGREYQLFTVDSPQFDSFRLIDGDIVEVGEIVDRFENRIEVRGAVFREGVYQLGGEINTIRELIAKAEGVTGDAFLARAVLQREGENLSLQTIQVDLKNILDGSVEDVALKRNDLLYIPSIHSISEVGTIEVLGEVAQPGLFPYAEKSTIEDMIILAGGLLPSASEVRVDVVRQAVNPKSHKTSEAVSHHFTFAIKDGFMVGNGEDFYLEPYDRIYIRKSPSYHPPQSVKIEGEVLYGGEYAISKKSERLSDLVRKAGGLTEFAYAKGARLIRKMNKEEVERAENALSLASRSSKDSIDIASLKISEYYNVGIDLEKAIENPNSDADLILRKDDQLLVPQYNNTVRISGSVMSPNTVSYRDKHSLRYYISQAGGFSQAAKRNRTYIVYMNGQIARGRLDSTDAIEPGCEIIVPMKEQRGDSLQSILSLATTSASLATMIATIANIVK